MAYRRYLVSVSSKSYLLKEIKGLDKQQHHHGRPSLRAYRNHLLNVYHLNKNAHEESQNQETGDGDENHSKGTSALNFELDNIKSPIFMQFSL